MKWSVRICTVLALLSIGTGLGAQNLEQRWQAPSSDSRPWNFWYWMYGAFTREGITADLEAMKANGLGGAYQFTIRGIPDPPHIVPSYNQLSPEWWDIWSYAVLEADRIGLQLSFNACDGWAVAGGPWITPELSMQIITSSETRIQGGGKVNVKLPQPPSERDYYRDIATFAYPSRPGDCINSRDLHPKITSDKGRDLSFLSEPGNTKPLNSREPCHIDVEFEEPFTVRSVYVHPRNVNYQAVRMVMQVSDDGVEYRDVVRLQPPRLGWYSWIVPGFTYAVPETTSRYFRFVNDPSGSEVMDEDNDKAKAFEYFSILELNLQSYARIDHFESKNGESWRVASASPEELVRREDCVPKRKLIDISEFVSEDGTLEWDAPEGEWTILRMGYTTNGAENRPAGGAIGLECDRFNPAAVKLQMESWIGKLREMVGPEVFGRVVKYVHVDSWECGSQNWSPMFRDEFKKRKGYDIVDVLPVMAGLPVQSVEYSEKVLLDVREVISQLHSDVFFRGIADYAHGIGCSFSCEAMAPVTVSDDLLHYQWADMPMGEFWLNSPTQDKPSDILDAVSGAHMYGKTVIGAEAFTETSIRWDEYPGMLKAQQDFEYAVGINRFVFHVNAHNPWTEGRYVGMTLDKYGLYFQRDQTWWKLGKAWMDYTIRCQSLLQAGEPVVDIAVWTGDDFPRRAVHPERLVPLMPGMFGPERVQSEKDRLAADPMERDTSLCGVVYPKNATLPQDWIDPMHGYHYDSFNSDVLRNRVRAKHKRMLLDGGMEYGVLVVPPVDIHNPNGVIAKESRRAIRRLKRRGVPVIDKFPFSDEDLSRFGIEPDFLAYNGTGDSEAARARVEGLNFCHRRTDTEDIYFVANHDAFPKDLTASFRIEGRTPEIWIPVTGEIIRETEFTQEDGRVTMPLHLDASESLFIIFKDEPKQSVAGANVVKTETVSELDRDWTAEFDFRGKKKTVKVNELFDWKDSSDPFVKYYSGTAEYTTTFAADVPAEGDRYFLEFGNICNIAEIFVNGKSCGTLWTPPYRIDVTDALADGENTLGIHVANTWANHIKGVNEKKVSSAEFWTLVPYWPEVPLQHSGVIGPVRLTRK
ncbi:MAG: DNA-binding protein [Bacteroidales bacterium]|nr:DNA-binding protein [Bacteroidales bacterium]